MSCPALPNKSRDWERTIQEQKQSGLSVCRWCQQNQISYNTFLYWKRRCVRISSLKQQSFIELSDRPLKSGIELECNSVRVHLDKDFDALTLKKCVQALKELRC